MNEFTKEELEILHSAIDYWTNNIALRGSLLSSAILVKIQSMIENYCEHEHTVIDSFTLEQCARCGEILNK